jgi:alkanesulfonate monooxygenase SsuD/methylene tetrahydromethanopterin reductase-like flavin-dependent oxidoreductase (luciferase family)
MHPMKITNAALTLNEYAQGRAMVVIGSGGEWPEVMRSPVFHTGYKQRLANVRETLEIVTRSIREGEISYNGSHYSALRFSTAWHNEALPLIYHGACGPQMLAMGATLADGVMMSDVMPAMFDKRLPLLQQNLAGRSTAHEFRISNFVAWHVRASREQSFAEARRELIIRGWLERDWLEPFLSPDETAAVLANRWPFLQAWINRTGVIEGVPEHVSTRLVEGLSLAGDYSDIDRHIQKLRVFAAAGFTEIALRLHEQPADSMRLIAARVLPEIAALTA